MDVKVSENADTTRTEDTKYTFNKADGSAFHGADLTITVVNNGSVATDDVVQVYVKDTGFDKAIPNPCLSGFKRVHLEAGEEKEVSLHLSARAFTSVDEDGNRKLFSDTFKVYAGVSQPDARSEKLTGHKCVEKDLKI